MRYKWRFASYLYSQERHPFGAALFVAREGVNFVNNGYFWFKLRLFGMSIA